MSVSRHPSDLANNLANRIYKNLDTETLNKNDGKWYPTVSKKILELIYDEICSFLAEISLIEVEQAIFNQADLDQFAKDMVGTHHALRSSGAILNIPFGITNTELTETYSNALKCRNFPASWMNYLPYSENGITYDILNSDIEARKKAVLLTFSHNLIKRASLEQCYQLCKDLIDEKKSFVNNLLTSDHAFSSWFMTLINIPLYPTYSLNSCFTNRQNTRLSNSYTNSLFSLSMFFRVIMHFAKWKERIW